MKHTSDGQTVMVTMTDQEWKAFLYCKNLIDHLYETYYRAGRTPGFMDGPKLWKDIMTAWTNFRSAQGI